MILAKKAPEQAVLLRFQDLEAKLIDEIDGLIKQAKEDIKAAIEEAQKEEIFKDLEPAKELAQKVADERISTFKQETNDRIKNILANVEQSKKDIMAKVESEVAQAHSDFLGEVRKLLDATKNELGASFAAHKEKFDEVAAHVSTLIGPQGDPGEPGEAGKNGENGADGENGEDGSPDTPEQVIEKVNTGTLLIKRKRIEGLDEELSAIKKNIAAVSTTVRKPQAPKGGGGGMGNWVHEVFSVSSATTTVTVANKIAAGGTAALVRYQGQLLALNVQYTIAAKVITPLFSIEDNTVIDVTYVRA